MVNTSAEAEAAVRACRYFPLGNRSNAGVRGEWGEFKNYRDYLDAVNNGLLIVPMIETNQSLENLDAIASVPGVDVLLIGPSDLSIELGVPLDYSCDTYQRALDKIAAAAANAKSAPARRYCAVCAMTCSAVRASAKPEMKRSSSTRPAGSPRRRRSSAPTISGRAMPLSRTIVSRCAGQSLPVGHSAISIAPTASFAISLASAPSGRTTQGRYCTMSSHSRPAAAALSRTIAAARAV